LCPAEPRGESPPTSGRASPAAVQSPATAPTTVAILGRGLGYRPHFVSKTTPSPASLLQRRSAVKRGSVEAKDVTVRRHERGETGDGKRKLPQRHPRPSSRETATPPHWAVAEARSAAANRLYAPAAHPADPC
jgi:hypothetical protein